MSENQKNNVPVYDSSRYDRPDGFPADNCIFTIVKKKTESVRKTLPKLELKVLLIKRKVYKEHRPDYPHQGKWALPGGFSERGESIYEAAKRELKEEANVGEDVYLEQYGTVYYPGRDIRGWMPTAVHVALVKEEALLRMRADDDAEDIRLFTIPELMALEETINFVAKSGNEIAFDHKKIILGGLEHAGVPKHGALGMVKQKMLASTVAKEFLPDEFTIAQLLQVIQTVVPEFNVKISNFIRKMVATKGREGLLAEALDAKGEPKLSNDFSNRAAKLYAFSGAEPKLSIYNSTLF